MGFSFPGINTAGLLASVSGLASSLATHIANLSNPHSVTKAQVGLSDVDNTSDADKPISTATQTALDLKAPIDSPAFTGTGEIPTLKATDGIVLPKTSGEGIKVDTDSPTFGWRDLLGSIDIRGAGGNDPAWNVYRAGIRQFQFATADECWINFHIPHDYLPGSDLFIHAHWSLNVAGITENVTWGFECSYAKGHDQAAFSAPVTATILQASSTTQYQHMIAETQLSAAAPSGSQLDSDILEVDGVILVRAFVSANSGATQPFLHFVDIHYQSTNTATKQKAPDFYV